MSEHGFRIDGLTAMHHELGRGPRKDWPKRNRFVPTAAHEDGDKYAGNAQRGNFFENQSNE
jgi:hypothetical protein